MSILIKGTNIEDLERAMLMFSGHEIVELLDNVDLIGKDSLRKRLARWQLTEYPEEGQNYFDNRYVTDYQKQYSIYTTIGECMDAIEEEAIIISAERRKV